MANPTKKRKVDGHELADPLNTNDSRGFLSSLLGFFTRRHYDTSPGHGSNAQIMQQTLSHMESMKQMLVRMEEKLDNVESRCEQLENKVDTLYVTIDKAQMSHDYNIMLTKNREWEYSPEVESFSWDNDLGEDEAFYLIQAAKKLRYMAVQMRGGEFPHCRKILMTHPTRASNLLVVGVKMKMTILLENYLHTGKNSLRL